MDHFLPFSQFSCLSFMMSSSWRHMMTEVRARQLCGCMLLLEALLSRHALHVALCKRFTSLGMFPKEEQFINSFLC